MYRDCRHICAAASFRAGTRDVLASNSPSDAFKFVQEVFWRILKRLARTSSFALARLSARSLRWPRPLMATNGVATVIIERSMARPKSSRSIEGVKELRETGYLHNHARMWFASIWVFTLDYLGSQALTFSSSSADGDPAANTLGWRWAAGCIPRAKSISQRRRIYAWCRAGPYILRSTAD